MFFGYLGSSCEYIFRCFSVTLHKVLFLNDLCEFFMYLDTDPLLGLHMYRVFCFLYNVGD